LGQPAGQQQAGGETQIDQPAQRGAAALGQPFEHQRRRQHEHQTVADAVGQAQQQQTGDVLADALGQGDRRVGQQRQRQGHAQARRRGQRQRQQGADQIADVVPGGQPRALLQGQQAVLEQVGQQGGVGEAAQGVDNDQGGAAGKQGNKDLTGGYDGHFLIHPGTTTSANLAVLRS